jgi:hypothetical protein
VVGISPRATSGDVEPPLRMSTPSAEPCPCEKSGRHSCFGPVDDSEILIRFIARRTDVLTENGRARVSPTSFASADINGARDGLRRRSVSMFRGGGKTLYGELVERACAQNIEALWRDDPVIAVAEASDLRKISDESSRREICVYADKTEADDPFGVCESHVSVRKSDPSHARHQRQALALLRSRLSDAFTELRHLISGHDITDSSDEKAGVASA